MDQSESLDDQRKELQRDQHAQLLERNLLIRELYEDGYTPTELANAFKLSVVRIHQLVAKRNSPSIAAKKAQAQERREQREADRQKVDEWNQSRIVDIYFVQIGDFIKIGCTDDIWRRWKSSGGADLPYDVILLGIIERMTRAKEQMLHRQFAQFRYRGEWFHAAPELLAYIESSTILPIKPAGSTSRLVIRPRKVE